MPDKRIFILKAVASFIAGLITVLALPPYDQWWALFPGISLFFFVLSRTESWKGGLLYGCLFGFGYFLFGLFWIGNAFLVEDNPYKWVWPLSVTGLPVILSTFPALAAAIYIRILRRNDIYDSLAFAAAFALSEWLRGHILTGFPWNLFGFGWSSVLPMTQILSVGGVYLLTFLTLFWGCLPGVLFSVPEKRVSKIILTLLGTGLLAASYAYGYQRLSNNPPALDNALKIHLVQPNIAQADKWKREKMADNFIRHIKYSQAKQEADSTTLIIWPETAVSYLVMNTEEALNEIGDAISSHGKAYLLTGALRRLKDEAGNKTYFNSLVVLNAEGQKEAVYDKAHLVPFGEYIPFQQWIPLKPVVQFEGFVAGPGPQTLTIGQDNISFSPLICYEVIFPGKVTPGNDQQRPDFLVNVTNDAWYGDSAGPYQHFTQAVFRAIEEGLPLVRSANTGISGIIDPYGRVVLDFALNTAGNESVSIPQKAGNGETSYSRYKDCLFFVSIGLTFILMVVLRRLLRARSL